MSMRIPPASLGMAVWLGVFVACRSSSGPPTGEDGAAGREQSTIPRGGVAGSLGSGGNGSAAAGTTGGRNGTADAADAGGMHAMKNSSAGAGPASAGNMAAAGATGAAAGAGVGTGGAAAGEGVGGSNATNVSAAGAGGVAGKATGSHPSRSSADSSLLSAAVRETVVEGITSAETILFADDGRLFVAGDDGVYELTRDGTGSIQKSRLDTHSTCGFGGLAQIGKILYAHCYSGELYAASLELSPQFRLIYTLTDVGLANGVASDADGRLYFADSFAGTILRLKLDQSDPFKVVQQETWLDAAANGFPNGPAYFDSAIYFADFTSIDKVEIGADGTPGARTSFASQLTFFDDPYVDEAGLLVPDYLLGSVDALDPLGAPRASTGSSTLEGPSAIVPALGRLGFSNDDILVTEKSADRVAVLHSSHP
jgi:hypothetical protein